MPSYQYSPTTGHYRDAATGRLVADRAIRDHLASIVQGSQDRLAVWAERLATGRTDVLGFRTGVQRTLRDAHTAAGALAHGGWDQLDPSTRGFLGARLRGEYGYLSGLALDWSQGRLTPAQLAARLGMYGEASRSTFFAVQQRDRQAAGYAEERRILGAAEHCADCPSLAGLGWRPIGTVPPPGQGCACRSRCRCRMAWRRAAVRVAA